jgi:ferritin
MLKPSIEAALNRQLNRELYSSYLYLAMSAYYDVCHLPGFGSWLRAQAKEELEHGMKIYDYIGDAGGRPSLEAIEAPPREWNGPKAAFAEVVAHEQAVTAMINDLMNLAIAEKDHATAVFLQWFVTEQVEEEKNSGDILAQIESLGDNLGPLYGLDHHLGRRE